MMTGVLLLLFSTWNSGTSVTNSLYGNLRLLLQMRFYVKLIFVHQKVLISSWQHCQKWTHILHFSRHSNIHDVSFPPKHAMCSKVLLSKIMSMYLEAKNDNRNKNSIRIIFIVTNTYLVYFLH